MSHAHLFVRAGLCGLVVYALIYASGQVFADGRAFHLSPPPDPGWFYSPWGYLFVTGLAALFTCWIIVRSTQIERDQPFEMAFKSTVSAIAFIYGAAVYMEVAGSKLDPPTYKRFDVSEVIILGMVVYGCIWMVIFPLAWVLLIAGKAATKPPVEPAPEG